MKRLFYIMIVIFLLTSCRSEIKISPDDEFIFDLNGVVHSNDSTSVDFSSNNFSFVFEVSNRKNFYESKLTLRRAGDSEPLVIDYVIDTDEEKWELFQDEKVNALSRNASSKIKLNSLELAEISKTFESVFQNVPYDNSIKPKLALLAYHSSVISNIPRVNTGQGCSVYPMFLTGKSFFRCQEDVSYSRESIIAALDIYESLNGNDDKCKIVSNLLSLEKGDKIPFQKFYSIHFPINEFKNHINREKLKVSTIENNSTALNPFQLENIMFANHSESTQSLFFAGDCSGCSHGCGSSLGCCGNYSGCCLLWSIHCLAHDLECLKCDKWHCGWACVPSVLP